ncbi:MAG: LSM domain-containing protein [Promethearchaeota archaeon]
MPPSHDPISTLGSSLGKQVIIKCKRHKTFTGVLKSFNTHLNVLLENVSFTFFERNPEKDNELEEKSENFDRIVLRGDSIVFIGLK